MRQEQGQSIGDDVTLNDLIDKQGNDLGMTSKRVHDGKFAIARALRSDVTCQCLTLTLDLAYI